MSARQVKKQIQGQKKQEKTTTLINKVASCGGVWKDQHQMEEALLSRDCKAQYAVVCDQIRLYKQISGGNIHYKLFQLSCKGHKLTLDELKANLLRIMDLSVPGEADTNQAVILDKNIVVEKIDAIVAAKRRELQAPNIPKAKKRKSFTSLVGKNVLHQWKTSDSDSLFKWYTGTVISALGDESDNSCKYEIKYEGDDIIYEVQLQQDLAKRNLVII